MSLLARANDSDLPFHKNLFIFDQTLTMFLIHLTFVTLSIQNVPHFSRCLFLFLHSAHIVSTLASQFSDLIHCYQPQLAFQSIYSFKNEPEAL